MSIIEEILKMQQSASQHHAPAPQPAAPSKGLTAEQFAELEKLSKSDDRTGFYIKYYEFTGVDQALEQAQISSFSDFIGGVAEQANKLVEDHANYPKDTADKKGVIIFSEKIKDAVFEAVRKSYLANGGGIITDLQMVQAAQQEWEEIGMKGYFPGNAEVVLEKLMDNGKTKEKDGNKAFLDKISDIFSDLFSRGTAVGIAGMAKQIAKDPLEIFGSSTLNTMLKAEGYTRHVTPDLKAVYFTDNANGKTVYVSAPNTYPFTNSQGKTSYLFHDRVKNINEVAHLFNVPVGNVNPLDIHATYTAMIFAYDLFGNGKTFIITPEYVDKRPTFSFEEIKGVLKGFKLSTESRTACEAPSVQENSCKVESVYGQGAASDAGYQVKKGDTVWSIAQEHGKTIKDILDTPGNEFLKDARHKDGSRIFPGEKIHVAGQANGNHAEARSSGSDNRHDGGNAGGQAGNAREVQKGDTVWSIAKEHGRTVNDILNTPGNEFLKDSRHDNGNKIFPGEKIHISHSNTKSSYSSGADNSKDYADKERSWGKGDDPFSAAERALGHSLETESRILEKSHSSGSHYSGSHSKGSRSEGGGGGTLRDSRGNEVKDSRGNSIGAGWGKYKPVAIDLDGNGLEFLGFANSKVKFDIMMDGRLAKLDWINGKDGLLCYDADNNGKIDSSHEISFSMWDPLAASDLEALALVFDTNGDGFLDASDQGFEKFYIWRDQNENAIQENNELFQLIDFGIERIKLKGTMFNLVEGNNILNVLQISEVHYNNDTVYANAYDIVLEYAYN